MIDCNPRTYSGNCAGRTAASSMNATGFAGPMHPVKSDRPDLRTDQTIFICAGSVTTFLRSPTLLDCKIDNRSATSDFECGDPAASVPLSQRGLVRAVP